MKNSFEKHLRIQKKINLASKKQVQSKNQNYRCDNKSNVFSKERLFQKIQSYLLETHSILIQNLRNQSIQRDLNQEEELILTSLKQEPTLYNLFSGILAVQSCVKEIVKQNNGIIIAFVKAANLLFINFKLVWKQFQAYRRTIRTSQSLNTSIKIQNQENGMVKFFDSLKFLGIIIKNSWGQLQQISEKDNDESIMYQHMKQQIQKLETLMTGNFQSIEDKLVQLQNNQQQIIISELQKENSFLKWRISQKENTITQYEQSIYNLDLSQQPPYQKDQFNIESQININPYNGHTANFKQIDSNFIFNEELINQKITILNQQIQYLKNKVQILLQQNEQLKEQAHCSSVNVDLRKYDTLLEQIDIMKTDLHKFKSDSEVYQQKLIQKQKLVQEMNQQFIQEMQKYNAVFHKLNTQIKQQTTEIKQQTTEIKNLQKVLMGKDKVIEELTKINCQFQSQICQNKSIIQDIQNKILKIPTNTNVCIRIKPQTENKKSNVKIQQIDVKTIQNKSIKTTPSKNKQMSPLKKIDLQISGGKMSISQKKIQNGIQNQNKKSKQKGRNQYYQKNLQQYLKLQYEQSNDLKILRSKSKSKNKIKRQKQRQMQKQKQAPSYYKQKSSNKK